MNENVRHILLDAIENKKSLTVIYLGGSQPGTLRDISPISISEDKLRARCHSTDAVKFFNIGKIQLPSDSSMITVPYGSLDLKVYETMRVCMRTFIACIRKVDGELNLMIINLLYLIFSKMEKEKKQHLWQFSLWKDMRMKQERR
ncbi:hypothetical protein I5R18_RS00010 [Escherichia coli]